MNWHTSFSYGHGLRPVARPEPTTRGLRWRCEQTDGGWLIVCSDWQEFAAHIPLKQWENHYDKAWLFWATVNRLRRAALNRQLNKPLH